MPKCPNCRRRLIGHGLFLFGGHDLIVCKRCGCRLTVKASWWCAFIIACIGLLLMAQWAYAERPGVILAAFIVWACCAPFVQQKFTSIEKKHEHGKSIAPGGKYSVSD